MDSNYTTENQMGSNQSAYTPQLLNMTKLFGADGEDTFSGEESMNSLPVPDLNQTLDLYLDSTIVHLTPPEYRNTLNAVEEFRHGLGPKLHAKLIDRASKNRNWLEAWWEEMAYMRTRSPLSPGANMCGPGPYYNHFWPPKEGTQLFRAAVLIFLVTQFRQHVRHERMPIDRRSDGTPLTMSQHKRLFNGSREPGLECDALTNCFRTRSESHRDENSYVLVISNGRIFRVEVLDIATDEQKSIPELHLQLQRIRTMSREVGVGLPLLTALERCQWAKARQHLVKLHPRNKDLLDAIDKAAFCMTLDNTCPASPDEMVEASLRSGEGMTWADKSYSLLAFRNGVFAISCDHAQMDGMALMMSELFCDVEVYNNKGYSELETEVVASVNSVAPPSELKFVVDDFIREQIELSRVGYLKACANIEARLPRFRVWGRRQMKALGVHPDTAVQLVLQLAFYRLHGRAAPTYETATTRRFWRGRTETLRSCTPEAINWSRAMLEPGCTAGERRRLFSLAHDKHNALRRACEAGRGCDRHLLGLARVAMDEGLALPSLFTDPAWVKSGGNGFFTLSTSSAGGSTLIGCVSAMYKDGYGCFYTIDFDGVEMVVTTFKESLETKCSEMIEAIERSMKDMLALLNTTTGADSKL